LENVRFWPKPICDELLSSYISLLLAANCLSLPVFGPKDTIAASVNVPTVERRVVPPESRCPLC
jgi:hypothetical protein